MNFKVECKKFARESFEMHPSEAAVIVKYQVHAVVQRLDGTEVTSGKKDATKLIYITNLGNATDLKRVAREAVARCHYLDPDRIEELEQVMTAIANRQKQALPSRPSSALRPLTASVVGHPKAEAKISDLGVYRSLLYNGVEDQIRGSEMILQLCQNKVYLAQVLRSEPVVNGMSRLLFEDESRNLDLKINISRIFAALSQLSSAPALFAKNRIGTTLLQELNTEEDRYRKWKEQLSAPHSTGKPAELDAARRKMLPWLRKQDLFISAALQVLLVLAHDVATQTKMAKKDIISLLSKISERVNPEVQLVSLRFLIAMSVYAENMKKFVQAGTVEKLTRILDHQRNALVTEHALKLMFNLSVCPNLRKRMVQKNVAKKLTHALETPATSELTARLLYSISIEPRNRKEMYSLELATALAREVTRTAENGSDHYLLAFAINLLADSASANDFASTANVAKLLVVALQKSDFLLLKLLNTAFYHMENPDPSMVRSFLPEIVVHLKLAVTSPFVMECFSLLTILLDKWLINVDDLIPLYKVDIELIDQSQNFSELPELMVLVMIIGAIATQEKGVKILCDSNIIVWLCQRLSDKADIQEEIAIQVGYALLMFTRHEPSRLRIMKYPAITGILSEWAQRSSDLTKSLFEELLFHLSTASTEIHEAWKMERFRNYNGQWLRAIDNRREEGGGDENNYMDEFNEDELDLVTRFGLDDISDEADEEEDVEDMIERYSARSRSRLSFSNHESYDA